MRKFHYLAIALAVDTGQCQLTPVTGKVLAPTERNREALTLRPIVPFVAKVGDRLLAFKRQYFRGRRNPAVGSRYAVERPVRKNVGQLSGADKLDSPAGSGAIVIAAVGPQVFIEVAPLAAREGAAIFIQDAKPCISGVPAQTAQHVDRICLIQAVGGARVDLHALEIVP